MEAKSFVKLLRKVIREEVQQVLRKEMRALLNEQKTNHKQVIDHGMKLSEISSNPKSKKTFTKNSMLNDILNETAGTADFSTMRDGPMVMQQEDYPQMGPTKTSQMVQQPLTGINGEAANTSKPEMQAVNKAVTRDYRALMAAVDKKKQNK